MDILQAAMKLGLLGGPAKIHKMFEAYREEHPDEPEINPLVPIGISLIMAVGMIVISHVFDPPK